MSDIINFTPTVEDETRVKGVIIATHGNYTIGVVTVGSYHRGRVGSFVAWPTEANSMLESDDAKHGFDSVEQARAWVDTRIAAEKKATTRRVSIPLWILGRTNKWDRKPPEWLRVEFVGINRNSGKPLVRFNGNPLNPDHVEWTFVYPDRPETVTLREATDEMLALDRKARAMRLRLEKFSTGMPKAGGRYGSSGKATPEQVNEALDKFETLLTEMREPDWTQEAMRKLAEARAEKLDVE